MPNNENCERVVINPTGDILNIRHGSLPQVFQYVGYNWRADSTDGMIKLIKAKGSKENSVITYTDDGFKVIVDDTVTDRPQSRINYPFCTSPKFNEWKEVLDDLLNQKDMLDFLRRREAFEIEGIDSLIAAVQTMKFITQISGDYSYDDNNNYTFAYKVGDAEGTTKLPSMLYVNMELFKDSGFEQMLEIEMELRKPKSEQEKTTFLLRCPKLPQYVQDAVKHEVDKVCTELDGYLIVAGEA